LIEKSTEDAPQTSIAINKHQSLLIIMSGEHNIHTSEGELGTPLDREWDNKGGGENSSSEEIVDEHLER
jgi:hypothetical protein